MKNNKMLSKIIAVLATFAIVLSFTGCKSTSTVASYKNDSVSAGTYIGFLVNAYYSASNSVSDTSKDLFSQKIDGKSASDYIKDLAKASCREYLLINELFDEYKLSFTADETADFDNSIDQIWDYIKASFEDNGCGKESFKKLSLMDEKKAKIFDYYYGKDGVEPVDESTIKDYFEKNCAKIKLIDVSYSKLYNISSSADATEDQKKEIKETAEKYLAELKAGKSFDEVATEQAGEASEVNFTFVEKVEDDEMSDSIFKLGFDGPEIVENSTSGYYIMERYKFDEEGKDLEQQKSSVLSSLKSDEFAELISKKASELSVTFNGSAVKRYSPKNISFN